MHRKWAAAWSRDVLGCESNKCCGYPTEWLRLYSMLEVHQLSKCQNVIVDQIREAAFKAAFQHTSDAELSGDISDDFEIIAKALAIGIEEPWLSGLFNLYMHGRLPSSETPPVSTSLKDLVDSLR